MSWKYSSHCAFPENVLPRKGRRERDHEGPCSVIWGCEEKCWDRRVEGAGGERSAWQKAWVVVRREVLRSEVIVVLSVHSVSGT